ncbi:MAG TPA: 16S rRNA (guanine(527)-N(7))-methyltransferase RsmG [Intrasporangium sp.]|uniref:16S rRNA (guanine(527)-N(7))-methyltransferase RsmG n=1 Tax=Intrasporangium sp. TaxID=1925024 RepID=UPI002D795E85|nr:16S rRNA (guanine(527)-N(7))-methyltransferase RsmG [Intrasporangium sp.]HET7398933.1 16S rRNA (guanine(527)-N(7))-methyltransferase RsmG [Intrasporangium sp.]
MPSSVPAPPPAAGQVFGERLPVAESFVERLAVGGIERGLLGPREAPRLWDRHVLNCAVVAEAIPRTGERQRLVDVGSGAGLPGLAIAIARPDLEVHLVEPLSRRTAWLRETVQALGLDAVTVHTARAESLWGRLDAPWVTARAVAGILQLAQWTLPLLARGGTLLALKGSRAGAELEEARRALTRLGVVRMGVEELGADLLVEATTVLRLGIDAPVDLRRFRRQEPSSSGSARRRSDRRRQAGGRDARPGAARGHRAGA